MCWPDKWPKIEKAGFRWVLHPSESSEGNLSSRVVLSRGFFFKYHVCGRIIVFDAVSSIGARRCTGA